VEFNGFILLAVLWFLVNLFTSARRKQTPPSRPSRQRPPEPRTVRVGMDPSQEEGSRLEQMLRDLQRTLEDAAQTQGDYPPSLPLPRPRESPEETSSLEVEPEVRSLEEEVRREARRRVDQDEGAADIETRRIQAAAARDHAQTGADHVAFHKQISQEPADHTATRAYTTQQLRDAVVWREILGPPVGLREREK
jgi:hypothetical protein